MDVHHLLAGLRRRGKFLSQNCHQAIKKPGPNEGSAGILSVPGLFSELFNVAASRPAQMTTDPAKLVAGRLFVKPRDG